MVDLHIEAVKDVLRRKYKTEHISIETQMQTDGSTKAFVMVGEERRPRGARIRVVEQASTEGNALWRLFAKALT